MRFAWLAGLMLSAASVALAQDGQARESSNLEIVPSFLRLDSSRDRPGIVALATRPSGVTIDISDAVEWRFSAPRLARLERGPAGSHLVPVEDGVGKVWVEHGGLRAAAVLEVRNAKSSPPVSFANDVVPVLTRAGCNAGSCHGAAVGKNGFRLSLFGYDKGSDFLHLTREMRGRRMDVAEPDLSLMLRKPTGGVAHKGGKRLEAGGAMYGTLRQWIADGAPGDLDTASPLVGLELLPGEAVMAGQGQRQRFVVRALYADGSDRDVTTLSLLSSSNETAAAVDDLGFVTSGERGEATVMARYETFAVVAHVIVLPDDEPFSWPGVSSVNYIDEAVHDKLRKLRVAPAEICSDEVFVRRVHLDLLNLLPTVEETRAFLADRAPDKRRRLVDSLLERPEFADAWAMEWAEVLEVNREVMSDKGAYRFANYLRDAFRAGRPFDEVVRELLVAQGGSFTEPAANFYLAARTPQVTAEKVAQNFLGVRLQCAQCHNHPFENWTMDDYYGFAAFFAHVGRKRGEDYREWFVYDRGTGAVRHKLDDSVVQPKYLGGQQPDLARGSDWRRPLADWLTSPDNAWFANNVANRVWARMFGRGIVDPPDDVRISNPPSHPRLHERLGRRLVELGFDIRPLVADICASRTYQLARHPDGPPAALYAGNQVRRLTAEQLLDGIGRVTAVPTKYSGLPLGAPATAIAGGETGQRLLDVFGRPSRTSACTCDRRDEPTLSQALHLINGETIERKIRDGKGRVRRGLAEGRAPEDMLEELFLAAYCRLPTATERERLLPGVMEAEDPAAAWEDLYWAVLNSKEFLFQH